MRFLTADMETQPEPSAFLRAWQNLEDGKPIKTYFKNQDEWDAWQKRSDPVLHIELVKISSLILIAPLSANTLGKLANGLADNLLTCVFRAWHFKTKPAIVAPAMNTYMYENPITDI